MLMMAHNNEFIAYSFVTTKSSCIGVCRLQKISLENQPMSIKKKTEGHKLYQPRPWVTQQIHTQMIGNKKVSYM